MRPPQVTAGGAACYGACPAFRTSLSPQSSSPCGGPPASRDRRSVLVELTPAGRAVFDQAHPDLLATEAALLGGLTPRDRTTLARLLAKLAASLEQKHDTPESA